MSLVVVTDLCVNIFDTISIATPLRISSVARLWRSMCGVNPIPVRARSRPTSFATASYRNGRPIGADHKIDEHVIGVQRPVFGVHVAAVEADQRR